MTQKYEIQCWSCHSFDMKDKGTYSQCRNCGATWNEVPALTIPPVVEVSGRAEMSTDCSRQRRYRPHGALTRQVAKKHAQKTDPGN